MYSNVTPPTLPAYDSVANPYYLIQFEYALGAEDWSTVRFWYGAAPLTWNGSAVTNSADCYLYTWGTGSQEWTAWGVMAEAGEMALAPGVTTADTYMRLYTNHDILDGTGAVWLAEGTVTPTEADKEAEIQTRIKSKLAGFIAAWCAPVRQFPKREPVAFLYGHVAGEGETPTHNINGVDYVGVVLPKLPVVEGFENMCIYQNTITKTHLLFAFSEIEYTEIDGNRCFKLTESNHLSWSVRGTAEAWSEREATSGGLEVTKQYWANFNIRDTNGTVILAASEPIPVYE